MGRWVTSKGRRFYILDKGEENPFDKGKNAESTNKKGGWDFRGIGQTVDKLESKLAETKSHNTVASIYKQLNDLETALEKEAKSTGAHADENAVLTLRRRIRLLKRKVKTANIL